MEADHPVHETVGDVGEVQGDSLRADKLTRGRVEGLGHGEVAMVLLM
jgi:hypothetical protein